MGLIPHVTHKNRQSSPTWGGKKKEKKPRDPTIWQVHRLQDRPGLGGFWGAERTLVCVGCVRNEGEGVGGFKDVGHVKSCCHGKELAFHCESNGNYWEFWAAGWLPRICILKNCPGACWYSSVVEYLTTLWQGPAFVSQHFVCAWGWSSASAMWIIMGQMWNFKDIPLSFF